VTDRRAHTIVDSPLGPITLVASNGVLSGLYMDGQRYVPLAESFGEHDIALFEDASRQVKEYFDGSRSTFDLPVTLRGSPFQRQVWQSLQEIHFGETISYGELAVWVGRPKASRAVGHAVGHNPISIVVPCHRVVGADGSLTGYAGGIERKRYLLALEAGGHRCAKRPASTSSG
jgi:methylated-DNA-[protein]-cysteine S-methyltransferase